mgnify:CR=1 FL=1
MGINEDPVTGSAHTKLVPYWASIMKKDNLWKKTKSHTKTVWAGETDPAWSSHPLAGSWIGLNPTTGAIIDTIF